MGTLSQAWSNLRQSFKQNMIWRGRLQSVIKAVFITNRFSEINLFGTPIRFFLFSFLPRNAIQSGGASNWSGGALRESGRVFQTAGGWDVLLS